MASLASKRKREPSDMPNARPAPHMGGSEFDDQYLHGEHGMEHGDLDTGFAAALTQHNAGLGEEEGDIQQEQGQHQGQEQSHQGPPPSASDTAAAAMAQYHTMTVPQSTEQAFMTQPTDQSGDRGATANSESGNTNAQQRTSSFSDFDISQTNNEAGQNGGSGSPTGANSGGGPKPQVGTEEWHKVRRDNHKEVERRRRETINEGINELAKIVPGCEKNKGSILARAVQFITQLKENETQNIEKWTLEKLLTEQAIAELSSSCDKLKAECQRAWAECEQWKKAAQRAGVSIDTDEKTDADGEDNE